MTLGFYPDRLLSSLEYMGLGMLGIFVVILAIYGCIVLLNLIFSNKKKKQS